MNKYKPFKKIFFYFFCFSKNIYSDINSNNKENKENIINISIKNSFTSFFRTVFIVIIVTFLCKSKVIEKFEQQFSSAGIDVANKLSAKLKVILAKTTI